MEALFLDNDILELEGIEEIRSREWINYNHEEKGVPRVSHILAQCENQEGLIQWAANIGRRKYDYYREKALNIGTIVHENIDEYLMSKYVYHTPFSINFNNIEDDYRKSVYNSFENFKLWEKRLEEYGCKIEEVVGLEIKVTCPWYGGTIDGIVKINGRYYIIDFKTSKKISMSYFLQASAYMWIVNNGYAPMDNIIDIYNEKYFFTGGALYKTLGDKEMLYYKTVSYILDNYDNIKFLYAGTGDDTEIKKLEVKYSNRVFHINERGDFFEIIKHSVLYLNSYPMFGGLMMRYAALAQKVPITLKHDNDAEGILINQADLGIEFDDYGEYLKEIDKLLSDDIYRKKQEDKLQGATIDEESFSRNIKMIIEEHKTEYSFINIPRIDTTRFRLEYLERNDMHSMYKTIARKNNYLLLVYFPKEFFFGVLLKIKGKLINDKL